MVLCCMSSSNSGKHATMGVVSGLLGAFVLAYSFLPLILTDASHGDNDVAAAAVMSYLIIHLILPLCGSVAASAHEWTSECTCHCCAMGCAAVCGIPLGIMYGIGGIAVLVVTHADFMPDVMVRLAALFSIVLFGMSATANTLGGVSIAAWCEGCENDSKRRKGSLIVGQPVMVAPSIYHQHPSMYYQQQQPPSNQQQSMEYHVGQAPMYQTAYQPAY